MPTQDDLKMQRDGQLSAGRPPPKCETCGEPIRPGEESSGAFVDGTKDGRRTGWRIYWHEPKCRPAWVGGDSVTREEEA